MIEGILDEPTKYLVPFIIALILFIISVLITRAIFSVSLMVKNQKAQVLLLTLIAEKNGVDSDDIEKILEILENDPGKPLNKESYRKIYRNSK